MSKLELTTNFLVVVAITLAWRMIHNDSAGASLVAAILFWRWMAEWADQ